MHSDPSDEQIDIVVDYTFLLLHHFTTISARWISETDLRNKFILSCAVGLKSTVE
jgi:hypothetical protein